MLVAPSLQELAQSRGAARVAVACGVFDGVHRGHRKILRSLLELASAKGAIPTVLTFDPHPRSVLAAFGSPPLLTEREQQLELLAECGIEAVVLVRFTREVAAWSATRFVRHCLLAEPGQLAGVCVGSKWRFGAGGEGDVGLLELFGRNHGFSVVSVPEFQWYGKPVSSTRIRARIQAGELSAANRMLGRCHAVRGQVLHGRGIGGARLHCPTANLSAAPVVHPPGGVYAARIAVDLAPPPARRKALPGAVYIGSAPTIEGVESSEQYIECHIFDFHENLYGQRIDVQFVEFIREGRAFAGEQGLADQIVRDLARIREVLGSGG